MNVLDLFSGIGAFSLGLERAGMTTVGFSETDLFCKRVLAKHWPTVPQLGDVRCIYKFADEYIPCLSCGEPYCDICKAHFADCACIGVDELYDIVGQIDVISAGFPCQDISLMNQFHDSNKGVDGERSGLFREILRIACHVRPKFIIMENVTDLLIRGFDDVLSGLAEIGFDAEWHCISAQSVGAEHRRDRVWIIAYDQSIGIQGLWPEGFKQLPAVDRAPLLVRDSYGKWTIEPDVLRANDGVAGRLDRPRLKAIGNSLVPQIPEIIGRKIMGNKKSG